MVLWDKNTVWALLTLVVAAGAAGPSVIYPFTRTCAVNGSTVTLPCTFTPLQFKTSDGGTKVPLRVVRVGWCKNHEVCPDIRPSVYDSDSDRHDPRYRYLGDKKANCTLQIRDVRREDDDATFRFRMEADDTSGHFTNRTGVRVKVVDLVKMSIKSSRDDGQLRGGETVSLQCSSPCTTHHLNITWFRDGHALSETGSALQLGPLAAEDSGNYTCGLGTIMGTRSEPIRLQVEADPAEEGTSVMTIVHLIEFSVITIIFFMVASFVIRRTCLQNSSSEKTAESEVQGFNTITSDLLFPQQDRNVPTDRSELHTEP